MKNLLLGLLFLNAIGISCGSSRNLKCSDCSNREEVLRAVNLLANKRLDSKIEDYQIEIHEDQDVYVITYINTEVLRGLKFGGGIFLKISKKDCRIIDYKKFK